MMIKHLVISGGAYAGFAFFGSIKHLLKESFIDMEKIESMYCTSVGTMIAVYFSLNYSVSDIETFMVERPWNEVYKINFKTVIRAIQEGGLFDQTPIIQSLKPMLLGKDLTIDVTLEEFYSFTQKEIHFFTTEYSELRLTDISYKTHPKWKLIDAVYASCCLPILFDPFFADGIYYVDGGVLKNYPLHQCVNDCNDVDSILGIYHTSTKEVKKRMIAEPYSSVPSNYRIFEYALSFIMKLWNVIKIPHTIEESKVKNQIAIIENTKPMSIVDVIESKDERKRLVELGEQSAREFLESLF